MGIRNGKKIMSDKLKICLRSKQFYQMMYAHDFIYGYIDQVDNEKLSKLCIENYGKRKDEDKRNSQSEDIIIPLEKEIKEIAEQMGLAYKNKFGIPLKMTEGEGNHWGQVHYEKESTQFHTHLNPNGGGSDISGVYYVKVPKDSGDLIMKYKKHEFDESKWYFPPEENKFILFSAGLEHAVSPNQSKEPRVIISINFNYHNDKNV